MNKRLKKKKALSDKFKVLITYGGWDWTFSYTEVIDGVINLTASIFRPKVCKKCTYFTTAHTTSVVRSYFEPYWSDISMSNEYQKAVEKFLGCDINDKIKTLKSGESLSWYRNSSAYIREYLISDCPDSSNPSARWHKTEFIKQ